MRMISVTNWYNQNYMYLDADSVISVEGLDERFQEQSKESYKYLVYTAMNPKNPHGGSEKFIILSLKDACRILGFDPETATPENFWNRLND